MNADIFKGKWEEIKGKAQAKWAKLTDDDIKYVDGRQEQLTGLLRQRYGIEKDEADQQVDEWLKIVN